MSEKKRQVKDISRLSRYFLLYEDAGRRDLEAMADYDLGKFPVNTFWTGAQFKGNLSGVTLKLTKGRLADTLGNPISWPIYSNRCVKLLWPLIANDVQAIALPVTLATGFVDAERYTLINPIGTVDAIHNAGKKKGDVSLAEMVLDTRKIPPERHMFRLKHNETVIVVTADVVQSLSDQAMQGFSASPVDLV
jgi:hypothetical protein